MRTKTVCLPRILVVKEWIQMKIRNNEELKLFEETLDRCDASVLLVTQQGEQYDLTDPAQRYLGIAELLSKSGYEEPELFTSCAKDEMAFFDYFNTIEKKSA